MDLFEPKFIKKVVALAAPVAFTEAIISALAVVDTIFIGHLGGPNIAAINLANQSFFLFILLMVGITSGAGVFTAQYWGNKDTVGLRRTLGLSLVTAVSAASLFSVAAFLFSRQIISFYTSDPAVIDAAAPFLKWLSISYIFISITFCFGSCLRAVNDPKTAMFVSITALAFGTFLNWVLIFGKFGAPALGLMGCAIATITTRILETGMLLAAVYLRKSPVAASMKELLDYPKGFILTVFKTSLPVLANEIGWALGITLYTKVYAGISTQSITAVTVAESITFFFFVVFFGTTSAAGVIIGNSIGEKQMTTARKDGTRILIIATGFSLISSGVLALLAPYLPQLFGIDRETATITTWIIFAYCAMQPFKVFNMHCVNGLLRSGGDTRYAMFMDLGGVWILGVPTAFLAANWLHLPVQWVYLAVSAEEIIKAIFGFYRVRSGKWINRVIA